MKKDPKRLGATIEREAVRDICARQLKLEVPETDDPFSKGYLKGWNDATQSISKKLTGRVARFMKRPGGLGN